MRLATFLDEGRPRVAVVIGDRAVPLDAGAPVPGSIRAIAAAGPAALAAIRAWLDQQPDGRRRRSATSTWARGPDPGAIYTIGLNYGAGRGPDPASGAAPGLRQGAGVRRRARRRPSPGTAR